MKKKFLIIMTLLIAILNLISINDSFKNAITNITYAVEENNDVGGEGATPIDEIIYQVEIVDSGESCETLKDALDKAAANTPTTLKLLQDVTLTSQLNIKSTHNIILDLNGKKLTLNKNSCGIYSAGHLKITDSSTEQTGTIYQDPSMTYSYIAIESDDGSLWIENGKIDTVGTINVNWANLIIGNKDNVNIAPSILVAKDEAINVMYSTLEYYSGEAIGKYDNYIYQTEYVVPTGYNLKTEIVDNKYKTTLIEDLTPPTIIVEDLGYQLINSEDKVWIVLCLNDDCLLKNDQAYLLDDINMTFKIGDEEIELSRKNVCEWYVYNSTVEIQLTKLQGDGRLTIEIAEDSIYDMAGNGNEKIILDTYIDIDNTAPQNPSVTINGGDEVTNSNVVTLELDAIDATEMWIKDVDYEVPTFEAGEYKFAVPSGFEIAELDFDGNVVGVLDRSEWDTITKRDIERGLVIVEVFEEDGETIFGNEFVWIPCTLDGSNNSVKYGEKRYSLITFMYYLNNYYFDIEYYDKYNSFVYEFMEYFYQEDMKTTYYTEKELRKFINDLDMSADDKARIISAFEEYRNYYADTNTDEEQDWIFESVEKYGGFYIGRYEIGVNCPPEPKATMIDENEIKYFVQKENRVFNTYKYLEMEYVAQNLYPGMSRLAGTYSWDALVMWLEQNGVNTLFTHEWYADENDLVPIEIEGPYVPGVFNRYDYSGICEEDKILNIYDLAGNYPEWIDEYIYYPMDEYSLSKGEEKGSSLYGLDSDLLRYGVVTPTLGERVLDLYNRDYYDSYGPRSVMEVEDVDSRMASYAHAGRAVLYVNTEVQNWIPYEETIEFEFTKESGEKTVEVYYRDEVGNVVGPVLATITLNEIEEDEPSILINDGDEETTSTNVKLTLDATDAVEMWIRNEDDEISNFEVEGIKVTVPEGFKIAKLDEDGNVIGTMEQSEWDEITKEDIEAGLVIVEVLGEDEEIIFGNEFVWIPCTLDGANGTVKYGEKRYSLINFLFYMETDEAMPTYYFDEYNSFAYGEKEFIDYALGENLYVTKKEFKNLVKNADIDDEAKAYFLMQFEEYSKELTTYTGEDEDKYFDSVEKHGGFYIGRYEMGFRPVPKMEDIDYSEYIVVQKDKNVAYTPYYEMIAEAASDLYPGMSRIMGTYSWDATLLWLEKNGINTLYTHEWYTSEDDLIPASMPAGPIINGVENRGELTGSSIEDKVLNIYDLAGNHPEWIDEYMYIYYRLESAEEPENEDSTSSDFVWYAIATPTFGERVLDLYNREYVEPYRMGEDEALPTGADYIYPSARVVLYIDEAPNWIPYQEEMEFELTPELGEKTVEAYYKYEDGSIIGPVKDTIKLVNKETSKEVSKTIYQNQMYSYDITDSLTDVISAELVSEPINGTVEIDIENNKITYKSNSGFVGKEIFNVVLENDERIVEVKFTITVKKKSTSSGGGSSSSKKEEPKKENILYANDDEVKGQEGEIISLTGDLNLLANDKSSLENVELKIKELVIEPKNGTLYKDKWLTKEGINGDGTCYYVPNDGYVGTDTFTYTITDGEIISKEATVKLIVKAFELKKEDNGKHTWYIQGYEDGTVRVDSNITREEVAMIFYRLTLSKDKDSFVANDKAFDDVEKERWSNEAISYLTTKGILKGYPDGTFKPGKAVTRAEFAAIIERYIEIEGTNKIKFTDIDNSYWAQEIIEQVAAQGWMNGYKDNTFKPENNITRGETMTTINRMLNRKLSNVKTENKFSDLNEDHWAYADVVEATHSHGYEKDEEGNEMWEIE